MNVRLIHLTQSFDRLRAAEFTNTALGESVELDNVATSTDGVDEDVAAGESVVAPRAGESDLSTSRSLCVVSKLYRPKEDVGCRTLSS